MRWLARSIDALPATMTWLTPGEAARATRLRLAKRRTEYLLRRLAGKAAVAAVYGLPDDQAAFARIDIGNNDDGSPYVLVDGAPAGTDISLTDRAGWAICLLSHPDDSAGAWVDGQWVDGQWVDGGVPAGESSANRMPGVGCDLELVEPRSDPFIRTYFTEVEQAYVASRADPDGRHLAANLIWSAKESALKVLRTGLRRDTRDVEVRLAETSVDQTPQGETSARETGWRALRVRCPDAVTLPGWWRRDGAFLLTTVAAGTGGPPRALEYPSALATASPIPATYRR